MGEFAAVAADRSDYPSVVYVHQGLLDDDRTWFPIDDPDVIAIEDRDASLYRAFTVTRGGFRAMFGLRAWLRGAVAFLRGHRIGRKVGDGWTLPTVVAVANRNAVWRWDGTHAGDHPDVGAIPTAVGN